MNVNYIGNLKLLKSFALATLSCSILSAVPRLLTSPDSSVNKIILIALSVGPAIGIVFQAIWLSQINKLQKKRNKDYFFFCFEVFLVCAVVFILAPIWERLIPLIYGSEVGKPENVAVFSQLIKSIAVFFAAMTMMNYFKIIKPSFESLAYLIAVLVLVICVAFLKKDTIESIYLSSVVMGIFSIIAFLMNLKKHGRN